MGDALTPRQTEMLELVEGYVIEHRIAPTVRELRDGLGLASTQSAHHLLAALRDKGLIEWRPGQMRTIRLVRHHETT